MSQPLSRLNDGRTMPQLGFGVFKVPQGEATEIVGTAIEAGYKAVDTAAIYGNEEGVGVALAKAGEHGPIALTTKLWNDKNEPVLARQALEESLRKLGRVSVDLYLIHWPVPSSDFVATWKAMIAFRDAGLAKSIGVSNFTRTISRRSSRPPESFRQSTRSNCTRPSSRPNCARSTRTKALSPNPGARPAEAPD